MRKRLFGLLGAAAVIVGACGPAASPSASGTAGASTAPSVAPSPTEAAGIDDILFGASNYAPTDGTNGGEVVIGDWQVPDQLNPYYSNAFVNTEVFTITMRGLWTVTHDAKWVPDLGATVPTESDGDIVFDDAKGDCPAAAQQGDTPGFTISIDLKPGLLWSDGEPLTLNDLKYTWEWNLDPAQTGLSGGTTGWDLIDTFEVGSDGLTAEVHFCTGFAGVYGLLSLPILPEHYMSGIAIADAAEQSYPVGPASVDAPVNGPFKYSSVSPSSIQMVRNDNFKAGVRGAPAYLDRVIFQSFSEDKSAMIAAALNGELDVALDMLQFDVGALEGLPATHKALVETAWEYEHFDFNQSGGGPGKGHPALTDPAVRLALSQAIDKQGLLQAVSPTIQLPDSPACAPTAPGLYWRTEEGLTCRDFDPAAAKAGLDAAGWTDPDGDGPEIREKDGVKLSLLHCHTGAPFRLTAGDFLASAMRDIGVELKNTPSPNVFSGWNEVAADAECNLAHGNYDTSEFAWVQSFDLFGDYYGYHSSRIPTEANGGAGNNYVRLNNPDMDALLDSLFGATSPTEQAALGLEIQVLHTELQPEVVLYYRSSARVVSATLQNFYKNPGTTTDMWNIEDWYLSN